MMSGMNRLASIISIAVCSSLPLAAQAILVLPQSGTLVFEVLEGHGATSAQEFGIGTPSESSALTERQVMFQVQLVNENIGSVSPSSIFDAGFYPAGTNLEFYQRSSFQGTWWAFSSRLLTSPTFPDLEVFTDRNGNLGLGGSAIQQVTPTSWIFNLDDAASGDDDDNELVVRATLTPLPDPITLLPEPGTLSLLTAGLAGLCYSRRKR